MSKWTTKPPLGCQIDWGDPLARSLVGCWLMNEGSGSRVNDVTGNGNTGTIVAATWTNGKFGQCLSFDGNADYVSIPNPGLFTPNKGFSVSAFVFANDASDRYVFQYTLSGQYARLSYEGGAWQFRFYDGTTILYAEKTDATPTGKWVCFTGTYDSSTKTIKVYHDGVQKATSTNAVFTSLNAAVTVLISHVTTKAWNGRIDGLRCWNRCLSALEVRELYASPFSMFTRPRIELWGALAETGGAVVTPGTASVVITLFTPTVVATDNKTVVPGTASLVTTLFVPTVAATDNKTVTPGTASIVTTCYVPAVAVTDNKTVTPGTASLTMTGFIPTVDKTVHFFGTPGTAEILISSYVPSVVEGASIVPGTADVPVVSYVPSVTVSGHSFVTPGMAEILIESYVPGVFVGAFIMPGTASMVVTSYAPDVSVTTNADIVPGTGDVVVTCYAPSVTVAGNLDVVPDTANLVVTCYAPTVVRVVQRHNVKGFETSDGIVLTCGSVLDGQYLKRVGTAIVGEYLP